MAKANQKARRYPFDIRRQTKVTKEESDENEEINDMVVQV